MDNAAGRLTGAVVAVAVVLLTAAAAPRPSASLPDPYESLCLKRSGTLASEPETATAGQTGLGEVVPGEVVPGEVVPGEVVPGPGDPGSSDPGPGDPGPRNADPSALNQYDFEQNALDDVLARITSGGHVTTCSVAIVDPGWTPPPGPVEPDPPYFPSPQAPVPSGLAPRCGTVVGTTKAVTLSASFSTMYASPPTEAVFEYRHAGEPDGVYASVPLQGERAVLTFEPGELGPGESYRWRVRGTPDDAPAPTWSDWCTVQVAADAPDLRALDDSEIDALRELRLRPERRYTVALSAAQWRLVREPLEFDAGEAIVSDFGPSPEDVERDKRRARLAGAVGKADGRLTLTGAQWATVMLELAGWVEIVEFGNDEVEPEFRTDTTRYWSVVDRISRQLGGPAHPTFGLR